MLTAEQFLGPALTGAGVVHTCFVWLKPEQVPDPGWFVVTRADGRRVFLDGVPPAQQAAAEAVVMAHDLTTAVAAGTHNLAKALLDSLEAHGRVQRAVVVLTVDELNILRDWVLDFKAAVAAAGTLAALKTAVAALPDLNPRTFAQVRTAIRGKIDDDA